MSNPFVETRFDPGIIPKGTGNIVYKTSIIRTHADFEKRNVARAEWLFEGDIGEVLLDARQVAYIIAFFSARKGKSEGFRYRYWGDYSCTYEPLYLGPTTSTQGVTNPLVGDGTTTTFQLCKRYTDAGDTTYKSIAKPVEDTVSLYVDGVLQSSGYAIDYTQGRVSFDYPPSGAIAWSGEFDLPVWFDTDSLPGVHVYNDDGDVPFYSKKELLYRFESLPVVELPIRTPRWSSIATPTFVIAFFACSTNVGVYWNKIEEAVYYTVKRSEVSGGPYEDIATVYASDFDLDQTNISYLDFSTTSYGPYYYVVTASISNATSSYSNEAVAQIETISPPELFFVYSAASASSVGLLWDKVNGAVYYTVKRSEVSGGPYEDIATVYASDFPSDQTTLAYTDATATPDATFYYYVVTASNYYSTSLYSREIHPQILAT